MEDIDISDEELRFNGEQYTPFNDQIPLIPTDVNSISEALQNFSIVFESRYGPNFAPFFNGTLQQAIKASLELPTIINRRPLVIYLHNDSSIAANIFAQNVLCSDTVSSLLRCQFVLWGWDMSQQENRQKLYTWLTAEMSEVADNVKLIHKSKYPLLLVLLKERGVISAHAIVKGHDSVEQAIDHLMNGLEYYMQIKERDVAEETSRLEREQIRQEQIVEYEKALAIDRARQQEIKIKKQKEEEAEAERDRIAEKKKQHQSSLAATIPDEPPESDPNIVVIKLRFPSGENKMRRFRDSDQLKWLVTYVESMGYDMENFRIWTSDVPKKNVANFDISKSFLELKWPRREQITVDEK